MTPPPTAGGATMKINYGQLPNDSWTCCTAETGVLADNPGNAGLAPAMMRGPRQGVG